MASAVLTPVAAESGYIELFVGDTTYHGHFPDDHAKLGTYPLPSLVWRGWISFDSSGIPAGVNLSSAVLKVTTVTSEGEGVGFSGSWVTKVSAADLDQADLPTTWASDRGYVLSVSDDAPTAFSVNISSLCGVLLSTDRKRIVVKLTMIAPPAAAQLDPLISSATLEVSYGTPALGGMTFVAKCLVTGGAFEEGEGTQYDLIIGLAPLDDPPRTGFTRFVQLDVQDAILPGHVPAWEPDHTWSTFVEDNDLWLYNGDEYVQGWGTAGPTNWRRAVDLSKTPTTATYAETMTAILAAVRTLPYAPALYMDDIGITPFDFDGIALGLYDAGERAAFHANCQAMAEALSGQGCMINGDKFYYVDDHMMECFGYAQIEGFRFIGPADLSEPNYWGEAGWGGAVGSEFVWNDWWEGTAARYGVLGVQALGVIPVIEAMYETSWSASKRLTYALIALATAALGNCGICYHEERVWGTPIWTTWHQTAYMLGATTEAAATEVKEGVWRRRYQRGAAYVNSTATPVYGIPAYSGRLVVSTVKADLVSALVRTHTATAGFVAASAGLDSSIDVEE